jgi:hypothetical protein
MFLLMVGALALVYWFIQKMVVRRLLRKGPLGNTTILVFAFVTGLAIGSGNFEPWVWIPLISAFAIYHWSRLKAFFRTIWNHS